MDPTALVNAFLAGYGPQGALIGILLMALIPWLKSKLGAASDPQKPLLDALLALLKSEPQAPVPEPKPAPPVPDEDRERLLLSLLKVLRGK